MKKIIFIMLSLFLIIALLNIKETSFNEEAVMTKNNKPQKITDSSSIEEEPIQKLFPEVFNPLELNLDKTFPILKITNMPDTLITKDSTLDLEILLPETKRKADIFLFVNNKKRDMFYQAVSDTYKFKNIYLENGENLLEIFYRVGLKKSISSYAVVYRE